MSNTTRIATAAPTNTSSRSRFGAALETTEGPMNQRTLETTPKSSTVVKNAS